MPRAARVERLRGRASTSWEWTRCWCESLVDVRYLTGFTGSNGLALIVGPRLAAELGSHRF